MSHLSSIPLWLGKEIGPFRQCVSRAVIFGSVATGSRTPSDCDLILVSHCAHDSLEWQALRKQIERLTCLFVNTFEIPLSVVLLTKAEEVEIRPILICDDNYIDL